jgi:hypothetical protein
MGKFVGDPYREFAVLDITSSALALVSVWWWLRALVRPEMTAAGLWPCWKTWWLDAVPSQKCGVCL